MRYPATVLRAGTLLVVTLAARAGAWEVDVSPSGGGDSTGYAVAIDAAGNVVIGGVGGAAADHFTVVKLASQDGADIWRVEYAPGGANSIVLDTAQNVYA